MMRNIVYTIWTLCCSVFFKYGIDAITNRHTSFIGVILIVVGLQVTVVFPLITVIGIMESRLNENR